MDFHQIGQSLEHIGMLRQTPQLDGSTPPVDLVGAATSDKAMYSDAFLMILSNKNNPILNVNFQNVFPTSLSGLDYTQGATDVEYMTADVTFKYQIYKFEGV
jgi:hypothetical protein